MPEAALTHAHQFDDAEQQREAAALGMWVFLATEFLFFSGLFLAYTLYRISYPVAFASASRHTLLPFGGVNTVVLILSSATMAFAVDAARRRLRTALALRLLLTSALGATFLVIKGFEYAQEVSEHLFPGSDFRFEGPDAPHARMFFYLYFVLTGIHALHVGIGVLVIAVFAFRAWRGPRLVQNDTAVDLLGLYWHFVDVVWVFLFPLIYLIDRHP